MQCFITKKKRVIFESYILWSGGVSLYQIIFRYELPVWMEIEGGERRSRRESSKLAERFLCSSQWCANFVFYDKNFLCNSHFLSWFIYCGDKVTSLIWVAQPDPEDKLTHQHQTDADLYHFICSICPSGCSLGTCYSTIIKKIRN